MNKFGKLIRRKRLKKNMMAKNLAKKIKVKPFHLSYWENGKSFPNIINLVKIIKILNISKPELFECFKEDLRFTE